MGVNTEPLDSDSWSAFEQEIRNDIINSNTIQFSIENDVIEESSIGSNISCSIDVSAFPIHKCIGIVSCDQENDITIGGDTGLAHSPLQRLSNGAGLSDFVNEILRSPHSLPLDLDQIDCCNSPTPSRILGMISSPKEPEETKLDNPARGMIDSRHQTTSTIHSNKFKSRPAENGVFVMSQRSVMTSAMTSRNTATQSTGREENYSYESRTQKRKRSTAEMNLSNSTDIKETPNIFYNYAISCRCSKTMCLKLYCDCFQAGKVCKEHCECSECKNTLRESGPNGVRTRMIRSILKRRPNAFQKKARDPEASCRCKSSK